MSYSFDTIITRENTHCYKYDLRETVFGNANVLPMWVADMDFKIADEIIEDITTAVNHGIYGYTFHYDSVFDSFIRWQQKRHSWSIKKEDVLLFHGVVPSLNMIIQLFTNPGDEIIVQNPVYFPFFQSIEQHSRVVVWNELKKQEGTYTMNLESLKKSISNKTKMLFLCHPHNPVGRAWNKNELEELLAICKQHNILVISDEIHADIMFGKKHIPWASLSEYAAQNSITLTAPSKTFNIAGLNISAIITQNTLLNTTIKNYIKQNHLHGINLLGLTAFESAYTKGETWLEELLQYLTHNIEYIQDSLQNTPLTFTPPEATYLAWINFSALQYSDAEIRNRLIEAGIGLNDGVSFGKGGEGYMRLNFACPLSTLKEGIQRIKKSFSL
ncbi:MAG: putative C-S lyase [Bacteroidales bacterium]|nr:putative C-S lyase [Bacteroidales bacterium]